MSKVTVLTDSVLSMLIKKHASEIPTLQNVPTVEKRKGCSCKGNSRKIVTMPDYESVRLSLINNKSDTQAIKDILNVEQLVVFKKEDSGIKRYFI